MDYNIKDNVFHKIVKKVIENNGISFFCKNQNKPNEKYHVDSVIDSVKDVILGLSEFHREIGNSIFKFNEINPEKENFFEPIYITMSYIDYSSSFLFNVKNKWVKLDTKGNIYVDMEGLESGIKIHKHSLYSSLKKEVFNGKTNSIKKIFDENFSIKKEKLKLKLNENKDYNDDKEMKMK